MSHENAKILYQATQAAEQKFEYFLTGAIGAMFAYTVQNYTPHRLDFSASTLEPIAIVCLAGAFFCGLKRIECLFHNLGINYEKNQALGDAAELAKALRTIHAERPLFSPQQEESAQELEKRAEWNTTRAQSATPILKKLEAGIALYYTWRNRLMLAGFSLIVAAKIAVPYSTPTKQPIPSPTQPAVLPTPPKSPTLQK